MLPFIPQQQTVIRPAWVGNSSLDKERFPSLPPRRPGRLIACVKRRRSAVWRPWRPITQTPDLSVRSAGESH